MLLATALALALAAEPQATPAPAPPAAPAWSAGFDRVDLISEEIGTFLNYDVLELPVYPTKPAVRFVEQVKVVFRLPWQGLYAGASIESQSLTYEHPIGPRGLFLTGGVVTRLLFPRGAIAGVAYRIGSFRFGLSASAFTSGSWSAPGSFQWTVFPSLGVGIGTGGP
ncbi:MAG TPA: hypothetical protein VND93_11300 [Myxococcales bacterium]|jgi:hypothetical protein|nr:hypothetical protein [Myxococcales bacterium]